MERKRKEDERRAKVTAAKLDQYMAAVDRKTLDSKIEAPDSYKLALFPVKILADWGGGWKETYQKNTIEAVQAISDDDQRVTFGYSYMGAEGISKRVKILPELSDEKEDPVWTKKTIFSQYEPNVKRIIKAGQYIDADLAVLVFLQFANNSRMDIFLFDYKKEKIYSVRNRAIAYNDSSGTIQSGIDHAIKQYFRQQ